MMIEIRANPHPAQRTVQRDPARFRVLCAGRRFGKTRLGVMMCLDAAAHGSRAWWVAPTYSIARVGWTPLQRIARRVPGAEIRLSDREVILPNGGMVGIRSADSANGLRGEGLDFLVIDEAAFVREEAWSEELRPALADRLGRALFISTPKGRNWFWQLYQRGVNGEDGWASFTFPTSANPHIAASEIEAARRDLPELIFRQEFLAEFVDMQGSVFRRVQEAIYGAPLDGPEDGRQYSAGVDVAASVDYTVVTVFDDQAKRMVYMDRYNRVDYTALEDRLAATCEKWRLKSMTVEVNSIGQPVFDRLVSRGLPVQPFTTTSASKGAAIMALQSAFEHGEITIANYPVLVGELLSFEARRSQSGSFAYSAPSGLHDDTVLALAIGWSALSQPPMFSSRRY